VPVSTEGFYAGKSQWALKTITKSCDSVREALESELHLKWMALMCDVRPLEEGDFIETLLCMTIRIDQPTETTVVRGHSRKGRDYWLWPNAEPRRRPTPNAQLPKDSRRPAMLRFWPDLPEEYYNASS